MLVSDTVISALKAMSVDVDTIYDFGDTLRQQKCTKFPKSDNVIEMKSKYSDCGGELHVTTLSTY